MGIEWHTARFLIASTQDGMPVRRTLTLGRQYLNAGNAELGALWAEASKTPMGDGNIPNFGAARYADEFLRYLGVADLVTLDASAYEGAAVVHDMNIPLETGGADIRDLRESFDLVLDGGTLEHVFNFPVAIKNAMEMVKVGGHLILQTPANNFFGHGFYQFSPELFYRVLCPENGFAIERMIAFECFPKSQWYEVADPECLKSRVELIGPDQRVLLLIRARRTHVTEIFRTSPQQSDYAVAWTGTNSGSGGTAQRREPAGPNRRLFGRLARAVRWRVARLSAGLGAGAPRFLLSYEARQSNRQFSLRAQPERFRPVDI